MNITEAPVARECHRAQWWRKARGLTVAQLAALTGYSIEAIYRFERGENAKGDPHSAQVWRRYKVACAAIASAPPGKFDWQME
jgi:Helix-turn-helix domain